MCETGGRVRRLAMDSHRLTATERGTVLYEPLTLHSTRPRSAFAWWPVGVGLVAWLAGMMWVQGIW